MDRPFPAEPLESSFGAGALPNQAPVATSVPVVASVPVVTSVPTVMCERGGGRNRQNTGQNQTDQ